MRTLLITGASGFLGWNLAKTASASWRVMGTYFTTKKRVVQDYFDFMETGRIDLTDFRDMQEMMALVKPDAVIHTAALSQPNYCETHPSESFRINVGTSSNLAGLCADRGIPFVFTSTDLVFDGTDAPYAETDPVKPISIYGEHKAEAEMAILDRYPLATICRMPLMFGAPSPTHASFLQWMINTLNSGQQLTLFHDEFRTPVSARTAASGLLMAAVSGLPEEKLTESELAEREEAQNQSPITGLLHLGGRERISRYEFGLLAQEMLNLQNGQIQPISAQSVSLAAQRPADVSLDSSRAYQLGYNPASLKEQLAQLF